MAHMQHARSMYAVRTRHMQQQHVHVQEALSDKYSKFDETTGEPTHDKDGAALDGKVRDVRLWAAVAQPRGGHVCGWSAVVAGFACF